MFIEPGAQKNRFAPAERDIPFFWTTHCARERWYACCGLPINIWPVRQAKLGVSSWVKVPVEQGLTNHSYRVLQP